MTYTSFALNLISSCATLAAATAFAASTVETASDGLARTRAQQGLAPVTLSLPSCANKGTVVQVGVAFTAVNPVNVKVVLTQPTSGAPYLLEQKINKRKFDGSGAGTGHNFYIDPFVQIGGTATVKAVVKGVGSASGSFTIPCP